MFWRHRNPGYAPDHDDRPVIMEASDDTVVDEVSGPYDPVHALMRSLEGLVGVCLMVVEVIIGFRFFFLLAGANASNNFVNFIYNISRPLVAPFDGIISDRTAANGILQPECIIAMVVYAVAAWIVVALMGVLETGIVPRSYSSRGVHHFGRRGHAH